MNLPSWLSNAYQNYFQQTQDVNNKPYQQYGGQTVATPTADQYGATWLANRGASGQMDSQVAQQAALQGIVGGQYSVNPTQSPYLGMQTYVGQNAYQGQNPYLDSMINQSNKQITNAYDTSVAPQLAA